MHKGNENRWDDDQSSSCEIGSLNIPTQDEDEKGHVRKEQGMRDVEKIVGSQVEDEG